MVDRRSTKVDRRSTKVDRRSTMQRAFFHTYPTKWFHDRTHISGFRHPKSRKNDFRHPKNDFRRPESKKKKPAGRRRRKKMFLFRFRVEIFHGFNYTSGIFDFQSKISFETCKMISQVVGPRKHQLFSSKRAVLQRFGELHFRKFYVFLRTFRTLLKPNVA